MRGAERAGARWRIGRPGRSGFRRRPPSQPPPVVAGPTIERRAPRIAMFMSPNVGLVDQRSQIRSRRDACVSRASNRNSPGLCGEDHRLGANEEPSLGAHLITPRFAYAHHGVYVGGGTVIHYAAFACHWHRGPVEEVSLLGFAHGHPVWVRRPGPGALKCDEIVRRARLRLGENRYRLLSNNCEHFSEWCVHGEHRSPQVERLRARLSSLSRGLSELRRWLTVPSLRRSGSPTLSMALASRVLCTSSPRGTARAPRPATQVAGPFFLARRWSQHRALCTG